MLDKFYLFIGNWTELVCSDNKSFMSNLIFMLSLPILIILVFIYSVFDIIIKYIKGCFEL